MFYVKDDGVWTKRIIWKIFFCSYTFVNEKNDLSYIWCVTSRQLDPYI